MKKKNLSSSSTDNLSRIGSVWVQYQKSGFDPSLLNYNIQIEYHLNVK